jgi:hypothetical protein
MIYPNGHFAKFCVRSMVGIIPFFACTVYEASELENLKEFYENFKWFIEHRKDLTENCLAFRETKEGKKILFMPMTEGQRQAVLRHIWNPEEFRSNFGLRSLSKFNEKHPFTFEDKMLDYEPAESKNRIKGGNSNWRGPIWMQMNYLLLEAFERLLKYYGGEYQIHAPGQPSVSLQDMTRAFASNLTLLFCKNEKGQRPCLGTRNVFKANPEFQEHILFYEYFNPETGEGYGASHQTGWTALIANIIEEFLSNDKG